MIDVILHPKDLNGGKIKPTSLLAMGNLEDALAGLDDARWDVVIFCAAEEPPPPQALSDSARKVRAYHCPINDAELTQEEKFLAVQAANVAGRYFLSGARVLITCAAGKNRSGLVTALTIDALTGEGGKTAAGLVRHKRQSLPPELRPALTNGSFLRYLSQIEPRNPAAKMSQSTLVGS